MTPKTFECCEIGLGTVYLVDTHSVTNEVEYVFSLLSPSAQTEYASNK